MQDILQWIVRHLPDVDAHRRSFDGERASDG